MESTPHLVLFSRTGEQSTQHGLHGGSWYFRIENSDGNLKLEASDYEFNASQERLELLSVVCGLEALDQPSSVTLVTSSRQVSRAVRQGLEYWRNRDWKWERFGEKVPMKNADLWRRIDAALHIHDVRCRTQRFDDTHSSASQFNLLRAENGTDTSVVPKPKFIRLGRKAASQGASSQGASSQGSAHRPTNPRRVAFVFRPLIWFVRTFAELLQATSVTLQRILPEAANPRLT